MRPSDAAGTMLTIDLGAIASNYRTLNDQLGGVRCAAAVKANAYGVGVAQVAPVLAAAGCNDFFVATQDEALALRSLLPEPTITVLNGADPGREAECLDHDLRPALNDLGQIERWATLARERGRLDAVLHLDTGMCRLGLPAYEVERLATEPERLDGLNLILIMSHLACADDAGHPMNQQQRMTFDRLRQMLPSAPASLANSSGIYLGPEFHYDLARPGVALYGGNPTPDKPNPMAEVIRLQSKIVQVRDVDSPQTVGYGAAHRVAGPARIATVPVGYADGYRRSLSGRAFAAIGGARVPVVGRVSMDLISLDVSTLRPEQTRPGTTVDLIGGPCPLDEISALGETIGYELLTSLGQRYERCYIDGVS
jgi:alanine racemase